MMGTKANLVPPLTHMKRNNEKICCPLHLSDGINDIFGFPYTYRMGVMTHGVVPYTNMMGISNFCLFLTLISLCLMTNIVVRFPE